MIKFHRAVRHWSINDKPNEQTVGPRSTVLLLFLISPFFLSFLLISLEIPSPARRIGVPSAQKGLYSGFLAHLLLWAHLSLFSVTIICFYWKYLCSPVVFRAFLLF